MNDEAIGDVGVLLGDPAYGLVVLGLWWFAVGGAVGSFLNVVVYRLPMGISLIHPGSHCPACKHPIRWHDNVPVLGWFLLRGRCRDCRTRISFRYPLIEAIAAVLFLTVGTAHWLALGQIPSLADSMGMGAYYLVLLSTLLAAALIQFDGHRLPSRLFIPAVLVGLVVPSLWPGIAPSMRVFAMMPVICGVPDRVVVGVVGMLIGWVIYWGDRAFRREASLQLGLVGIFLCWPPIVAVGVVLAATRMATRILGPRNKVRADLTRGIWVFVLAWIWILAGLSRIAPSIVAIAAITA